MCLKMPYSNKQYCSCKTKKKSIKDKNKKHARQNSFCGKTKNKKWQDKKEFVLPQMEKTSKANRKNYSTSPDGRLWLWFTPNSHCLCSFVQLQGRILFLLRDQADAQNMASSRGNAIGMGCAMPHDPEYFTVFAQH